MDKTALYPILGTADVLRAGRHLVSEIEIFADYRCILEVLFLSTEILDAREQYEAV